MLTELRTKSQITIPKDIVARLGLHEGDKLEIVEKDGTIQIMPVAVYPKKYLDELRSEINETKAKIAAGDRASASVTVQRIAFATGVLPNLYAFHRYTRNSILLSCTLDFQFEMQHPS